MTISDYLQNISARYNLGNATEHTFRGDLQQLLESIVPDIKATNEPKKQACGAPDYVLTRKEIPIGYIEAKDIGVDLTVLRSTRTLRTSPKTASCVLSSSRRMPNTEISHPTSPSPSLSSLLFFL